MKILCYQQACFPHEVWCVPELFLFVHPYGSFLARTAQEVRDRMSCAENVLPFEVPAELEEDLYLLVATLRHVKGRTEKVQKGLFGNGPHTQWCNY